MFVYGEVANPLEETIFLIEDIVKSQITAIVSAADSTLCS